MPEWAEGGAFAELAAGIEYPVYAILLGLLGNAVLSSAGLRARLAAAFPTEFFIKTGLVPLGASINLSVIVSAAGPGQALILITLVFGFTWWLGGKLGLADKLRALLASAVSICGVSAAAGAVQAKRERLAYTASLVILFALRTERNPDAPRPGAGELWRRFPKFVLGFIAASVIATIYVQG